MAQSEQHPLPTGSPQLPRGLADNAIVYGGVLGSVSALVTLALMLKLSGNEINDVWVALAVAASGGIGMFIGGAVIYSGTRAARTSPERVVLLTLLAPLLGLIIASAPFLLAYVIGAIVAFLFGLFFLWKYAIVVTMCWSFIYLSLPVSGRPALFALPPSTRAPFVKTLLWVGIGLLVAQIGLTTVSAMAGSRLLKFIDRTTAPVSGKSI